MNRHHLSSLVAPRLAIVLIAIAPLVGCNVSGSSGGEGSGARHSARSARSGGPVSGQEAHRLVSEDHATLLDVRTPGEYAQGHVEGAINVPLQTLPAGAASVDREHPVVVYCQSGGRSAQARSILGAEGYTVYDLGPMSAWGG